MCWLSTQEDALKVVACLRSSVEMRLHELQTKEDLDVKGPAHVEPFLHKFVCVLMLRTTLC